MVMPTGLIELPGMKGEIRIRYDLTMSRVELEAQEISYANLGQVLIAALSKTVMMWAQDEARIIKPGEADGRSKDKSSDPTNDDNNC